MSVWSILPSALSTSPTNPKSIPSFRGRLWLWMTSMSAPVNPSAFTPLACNLATRFLLTKPPYTIVTTSSMSASVMRRPFTILLSMPRAAATFVARRPPPCTKTFLPGMAAKSFKSCANFSLSSTMAPPTFTTVTLSIIKNRTFVIPYKSTINLSNNQRYNYFFLFFNYYFFLSASYWIVTFWSGTLVWMSLIPFSKRRLPFNGEFYCK